jgi:hypothetical protein
MCRSSKRVFCVIVDYGSIDLYFYAFVDSEDNDSFCQARTGFVWLHFCVQVLFPPFASIFSPRQLIDLASFNVAS